MNKEYTQLADYIQERFSVQVINVTCTRRDDSVNLTLWFKYDNEANSFYKERFVVDSQKMNTILKQFKQIANMENKSDSIYRKHSVNHVFSSPTSIINFTSKKPSYDDTRRSGRDNELLQRAQNDL